ncbi:CBU_0592 family membrane protein [Sphingomonas sp. RB1R13]|uniref:CBU_0592 family membrane protein n=1 Tax=Sphingomonas sp. RB1R13 TaxID=3096159 RepID=UPI002FC7CC55
MIGWLAAGMILAAYGLMTARRIASDSHAYHWLNVIGAFGILANAAWHRAVPSVVLNIIWAGIGIVALIRMRRGRPQATPE